MRSRAFLALGILSLVTTAMVLVTVFVGGWLWIVSGALLMLWLGLSFVLTKRLSGLATRQ